MDTVALPELRLLRDVALHELERCLDGQIQVLRTAHAAERAGAHPLLQAVVPQEPAVEVARRAPGAHD